MLEFFRKKAASWGVKIIMGLIILAFAFWGTGRIRSGREQTVAEVGKEAISLSEFDKAFKRTLEGLEKISGRPLEAKQLREMGVAQTVLSDLINSRLLLTEAQSWGLKPSPQEVRETIMASPLFQRGGRFERDLYFAFLRQKGMIPAEFEEELARELVATKVQRAIISAAYVSQEEARRILSGLSQGLVFEAVRVPAEVFVREGTATEEELFHYYSNHQEEFRVPEKVTFAFVQCSPQGVLKEVSLDPREVEQYYKQNPQEFTLPERVRVGHIFVREREKAEEAMERLRRGEEFSKVAFELSEEPLGKQRGGDLGYLPLSDLKEEFSQALSGMKVGEFKLVEAQNGFHIVKLLDRKPEQLLPFDQVKEELAQRVRLRKAQDLCAMKMADLAYQAKKRGGIKAAAQGLGMEVKALGPVSAQEGMKGGLSPRLLEAAFSLAKGEVSQVIEEGGEFFVLEPLEKTPSRVPSFDEVKEEVRKRVLAEKASQRAKEVAHEIQRAWREGRDPGEILKEYGLRVETIGPLSRIEAAFYWSREIALLGPSDPIPPNPLEIRGGFLALRLKEVREADGIPVEQFREQLESKWQAQLLSGWLNTMAERKGVRVNPKVLQPYGYKGE